MPWRRASISTPSSRLMADETGCEGVPRRPAGHRNLLARGGVIPHPSVDTQVAAMVLRLWRFDLLRSASAAHHRRRAGQIAPLHRLDPPSAQGRAARICACRCDPSARRLSQAFRRPRQARPHGMDARGDEDPLLARNLSDGARARLGAPQHAGAQAEGAGHPYGGRRLARARGADARRAARARAQGRGHWRHRGAGTYVHGAARRMRSLPKGFERSRWGEAIIAAVKRGLERDTKSLPRLERHRPTANGQATVELLKVCCV